MTNSRTRKTNTKRGKTASDDSNLSPSTIGNAVTQLSRSVPSPPVRITGSHAMTPVFSATGVGFSRWYVYPVGTVMAGSGSWLYGLSQSYSRFKFHRVKVSWVPQCSTLERGQYTLGVGYDMTDFFAQVSGGINLNGTNSATDYTGDAMALRPSTSAAFWQPSSIQIEKSRFKVNKIPSIGDYNAAVTTIEASTTRNWFADGYIYLALTANDTVTPMGRVIVEFDVEFYDPIPPSFNA